MSNDAQSIFDEGLAHYQEGAFVQAEEAFKRGLALDQQAWEMRFYLGMTYARQGKMREAKQEFLSVRDMCPTPEIRNRAAAAFVAMTAPK